MIAKWVRSHWKGNTVLIFTEIRSKMVCFEESHDKCNFFTLEIRCKDYWFIVFLSLISIGLPAYTLGYITLYFVSWYFRKYECFRKIYDYFQSGLFPKKNRKSPHEIVQGLVWTYTVLWVLYFIQNKLRKLYRECKLHIMWMKKPNA